MPGNFSIPNTFSTGGTILASEVNANFTAVVNNFTPTGLDDYSANLAQMQSTADPYPSSVESLATSGAGELERLRYVIKQITGEAQWYIDPDTDLATHYAATAVHGATGAVVGTTNTQTLTNKTLTTPVLSTPTIADFTNANHTHAGASSGGAIVWQGFPAGTTVQTVITQTGAVLTSSTVMTLSDSVKTSAEGVELMALTITPLSVSSKLIIDVTGFMSSDQNNAAVCYALFQDSVSTAIAFGAFYPEVTSSTTVNDFILRHSMTAGTTSPTVFKLRAGPDTAGTVTFNGEAGARLGGGVMASSIKIEEIKQ